MTPEQKLLYDRNWRETHREHWRELKRNNYYKHRQRLLLEKSAYWYANKARLQPIRNKQNRLRKRRACHNLKIMFGLRCQRCGYNTDYRVLEFHHINSDGGVDRARFGGVGIYGYYLKHQDEAKQRLQLLCANCNKLMKYLNHENVIEEHIPEMACVGRTTERVT